MSSAMQTPSSETVPAWPWSDVPQALLEALETSLREQLHDGAVYLLIDPFLGDVEPQIDTHPRHPVPNDGTQVPAAQWPYLIELKGAQDPLLARSIEWAAHEHLCACINGSGAYRIGGWLQPHAENGGPALARQLGALLVASDIARTGRYLRLADRRVLALLNPSQLWAEASAIDWAQQLTGIAHWIYLDTNFKLRLLNGRPGLAASKSLRLNVAHWRLVADAEAVNRSLMAWQGFRHPLPDDAMAQVLVALERARLRGLREPEDLAAYVVEALRFPAFEQFPELQGRIDRALLTQQPLADRLRALRRHWS
jgi:hypothetical protein